MSMLEWALKYHELGLSVIPMRDKRPLIAFADRSLTKDGIKYYWTKYPNANIAIKTEDFFVVDIDTHEGGADGYVSLALYEHPEYFKPTLFQNTPSGGAQMFYLKRNGYPCNQRIGWLDGVDIKAHPNNYVMVPPSRTAKGVYEWFTADGKDMVTADERLIQAIQQNEQHHVEFTKPNWKRSAPAKNKTADLFETIEEGFGTENSGRNDRLARFVAGLLARGVDHDHIRSLARTTNANSVAPLPDKEVHATVESMIRKDERGRAS